MVKFIELFGNRSLVELLDFFLVNDKEYAQKEIIRKTKLSKVTSIKWLKKLEKDNLVRVKRIGVTKLYEINKNNQIIKQLKILKTILELSLLNLKKDVKIYLYGSSARGENNSQSDIDLIMMGKLKREDVIKTIKDLSKKIKRDIKFEIFTAQEWSQMARRDAAFYERVEKDKVEVI